MAAANQRTVVVLETGGAVTMPWLDKVGAVIAARYPGQRGGEALARLLIGRFNFSGKLPLTFPRSEAQLPRPRPIVPPGADPMKEVLTPFAIEYREGADIGYRWFDRGGERPLFPFGFGLSYTDFSYGRAEFGGGATPSVRVSVRNSGARAGIATPQLYMTGPGETSRRLVGWARVRLGPGEARQVTVTADPRLIPRRVGGAWKVRTGRHRLTLGTDAQTAIASEAVTLSRDCVSPR